MTHWPKFIWNMKGKLNHRFFTEWVACLKKRRTWKMSFETIPIYCWYLLLCTLKTKLHRCRCQRVHVWNDQFPHSVWSPLVRIDWTGDLKMLREWKYLLGIQSRAIVKQFVSKQKKTTNIFKLIGPLHNNRK